MFKNCKLQITNYKKERERERLIEYASTCGRRDDTQFSKHKKKKRGLYHIII